MSDRRCPVCGDEWHAGKPCEPVPLGRRFGFKVRVGCDVGFTGTRKGMSEAQKQAFTNAMRTLAPSHFRHGACVGADREAHDIVRALFPASICRITAHPSTMTGMTDDFCIRDADEVMQAKLPLERNRDIVSAAEYMIAAPESDAEVLRSGTWATIRATRLEKKPLIKLKR